MRALSMIMLFACATATRPAYTHQHAVEGKVELMEETHENKSRADCCVCDLTLLGKCKPGSYGYTKRRSAKLGCSETSLFCSDFLGCF